MAKSLGQIQKLVQWEARDNQYDLTTTQGLAVANYIYRRLVMLLAPPEFSREDTTLGSTADTVKYTWTVGVTFMDVRLVEMQDPDNNDAYTVIPLARTEMEFSVERKKASDFPTVYKRGYDGSNQVIYFAPAPAESGKSVRVSGIAEPTELVSSGDITQFISAATDDGLALLIAADIMSKRQFPDHAAELIQRASEVLSQVAGKEITPAEISSRVANA